jgi:energy-coupling factor transporter ATP-binding protein EcfA2
VQHSPAFVIPREPGGQSFGSTLEARDLSVTLEGRPLVVLDEVDLGPGDRVLVTSETGESLTAFAYLLAGLAPSPWRRAVAGYDWSRDLVKFESRVLAGDVRFGHLQLIDRTLLVPEDLDTWFATGSGYDELTFCGWVEGADPALDRALTSLIDPDLLARPLYGLSGGQKQRLALAAALVMRPACLILLNAFGWLDHEYRSRALETLLQLDAALLFCDDHRDLLDASCSRHWHLGPAGALTHTPPADAANASRTEPGHRLAVGRAPAVAADAPGIVEGRNLSFRHVGFESVQVLDETTFTIPRVRDVYLVGANGSGKSTLATLICGLESRYRGTLTVWNDRTGTAEPPSQLRASLGARAPQLLFQFVDDNLIRWVVGDYLRLGLERQGASAGGDVMAWLEGEGVRPTTRVPAMDMFQKKLVVLARMALTGCRLAFFDEPAWGLTRHEQERLLAFVDRFLGAMVRIWITHETDRVPYVPQAIVRIADGRVTVEA